MGGSRRSLVLILAGILAACGPPIGAPSTQPTQGVAQTSGSEPTATAAPSEAPPDLVGRLESLRDGGTACNWVVDDEGDSWEIKWPDGAGIRWDGDKAVLESEQDGDIAMSGDRVALRGYPGWYVEAEVSVKFDVEVLDPDAATQGATSPRRTVLDDWAVANGLAVLSGSKDTWRLEITDGTPERAKASALVELAEVQNAEAILLGSLVQGEPSYCQRDGRFTAESIAVVEPAAGS